MNEDRKREFIQDEAWKLSDRILDLEGELRDSKEALIEARIQRDDKALFLDHLLTQILPKDWKDGDTGYVVAGSEHDKIKSELEKTRDELLKVGENLLAFSDLIKASCGDNPHGAAVVPNIHWRQASAIWLDCKRLLELPILSKLMEKKLIYIRTKSQQLS